MDRLTSMSVFVKAVELGSFSAAAQALGTSSQSVGKHIQGLEQHLGVRLVNRTTRRQSLTDIGRVFFERARNILSDLEAAEALAAETRAIPRGRIRVNVPVTFGIHALTPRLPDYLVRYPEVEIDLMMSNRYVDLIDEGFDIVFRVGSLEDSSLMARSLRPYRLILCASPAYLGQHEPLRTPMELTAHSCLGFNFGALRTHWEFDGPEGRISVPLTSRVMMDNGEALLAAALAGLGIILQPSEMVGPEIDAGRLIHLLPDYQTPPRPFHLLYAPDRRPTQNSAASSISLSTCTGSSWRIQCMLPVIMRAYLGLSLKHFCTAYDISWHLFTRGDSLPQPKERCPAAAPTATTPIHCEQCRSPRDRVGGL